MVWTMRSGQSGQCVGTYRLIARSGDRLDGSTLRASMNHATGRFPGRILELGRSWSHALSQSRVMQLLWRGIAAYVFKHRSADVRCASLRVPTRCDRGGVTYLYMPICAADLRARALPDHYVDMRGCVRRSESARALPCFLR